MKSTFSWWATWKTIRKLETCFFLLKNSMYLWLIVTHLSVIFEYRYRKDICLYHHHIHHNHRHHHLCIYTVIFWIMTLYSFMSLSTFWNNLLLHLQSGSESKWEWISCIGMVRASDGEEGIECYLSHWKWETGKDPIGASSKVHNRKGAKRRKVESVSVHALTSNFL